MEIARRVRKLEVEWDGLRAEAVRQAVEVVEPHPAVAERKGEERREIVTSVRALIERVVVYPHGDPEDRDLELHGTLAALLRSPEEGRQGMRVVVAGVGFEPTTFRL